MKFKTDGYDGVIPVGLADSLVRVAANLCTHNGGAVELGAQERGEGGHL